jgi:multidrug efflux pump subunit AcrA (membrane-fusion protein)
VECTSDNHAACLLLNSEPECGREIDLVCREFLRRASSPGANPGFALSAWSQLDSAIRAWGKAAKAIQLQRQDALELARKYSVSIAGFAGTGSGVIGALAAVGLRDDGSDGRFSWLPGLPGLRSRIYTFAEIMQVVAFDRVESERGMKPDLRERINIPEHTLPILRDGKSVLLLQPAKKNSPYAWDVVQEK